MSRLRIVAYTLLIVIFGLLAYFANRLAYFPGDIAISLWLQQIDLPLFEAIMLAVSYIGLLFPAAIIVTLLVIYLFIRGKRTEAIFTGSLTAIEWLINQPLKLLVDRPRPAAELVQVMVITGEKSFPSGHALYALTFYGFLFYLAPVLAKRHSTVVAMRIVLALLIVLTAASRIYLGAHWFSDVTGGLILGGLLLAPAIILYQNYCKLKNA